MRVFYRSPIFKRYRYTFSHFQNSVKTRIYKYLIFKISEECYGPFSNETSNNFILRMHKNALDRIREFDENRLRKIDLEKISKRYKKPDKLIPLLEKFGEKLEEEAPPASQQQTLLTSACGGGGNRGLATLEAEYRDKMLKDVYGWNIITGITQR